MKDFDEQRKLREKADRVFLVGGQTFTYKAAVAPEVLIRWTQAATGEITLTEQEWLNLFDEIVMVILEPGQEEKWAAVRDQKALHPLNIADLREIITWLIVEATGRPTGEPSGSSNGSTKEGTESLSPASSSTVAVP